MLWIWVAIIANFVLLILIDWHAMRERNSMSRTYDANAHAVNELRNQIMERLGSAEAEIEAIRTVLRVRQ